MAAEPLPLESVPLQDLSAAQNQGQQEATTSAPSHDAAQVALDATSEHAPRPSLTTDRLSTDEVKALMRLRDDILSLRERQKERAKKAAVVGTLASGVAAFFSGGWGALALVGVALLCKWIRSTARAENILIMSAMPSLRGFSVDQIKDLLSQLERHTQKQLLAGLRRDLKPLQKRFDEFSKDEAAMKDSRYRSAKKNLEKLTAKLKEAENGLKEGPDSLPEDKIAECIAEAEKAISDLDDDLCNVHVCLITKPIKQKDASPSPKNGEIWAVIAF